MSPLDYIPFCSLPSFVGIEAGETVLLASDLTRLAMTAMRQGDRFNPDKLIDCFLEILGKEGTLILPAFNFNFTGGETFDRERSLPITGALAETALKRNDFKRTRHPLHSFLVSGRYAVELAKMNNDSSFGEDSPFAFFKDKNAVMLMIGTTVNQAFTFVHYVEELEKVKYRYYRKVQVKYITTAEDPEWREYRIYAKKQGWTMNLSRLENIFRDKGILTDKEFNGIRCSIVRLGDAFPIIRDDILLNGAANISHFSPRLMFREYLKKLLASLHLYKTLTEKIIHDAGPR